jgi:cysteine desulfurase
MIYLDNSATTNPEPDVIKSFEKVSASYFANPSSIHSLGGQVEKLYMKARIQAAELLGVQQNEIIFTSGGTEGNNMAIKGIALEHQRRGKHIITTEIEHPSVYEACKSLEKLGFEITFLPVSREGIVSLDELENVIRKDTILISVMHVNNETGAIQPIKEIGDIAAKHPKLFFHVDDVQGLGKVPLDLRRYGIDLCTYSGHKIHGLNGTGILYMNNRVKIFPLFHGGNQERALRSGTENVAGAVSMVKALRLIKEKENKDTDRLYSMRDYLRKELNNMDGVVVNTPADGAPHIINFSVPGTKPEVIIHMLAEKDIFISTKSACASKDKEESKVLVACGFNRDITISGLRISLSYKNSREDVETFLQALREAINQFKQVMR